MPLHLVPAVQDTTIVAVARDSLALVSSWMTVGIGLAFAAILLVSLLVLAELRQLSRAWSSFLTATSDRSRPLIEHANNVARNLDHITQVVRSDVDRLNEAFGGLADGIGDASEQVKGRMSDLSALLDLAQSEAEEAVVDAAAKVRVLRAGAGLLRWPQAPAGQTSARSASDGEGAEGGVTDDAPAARKAQK